jgi:hypothetical protein
MAGYFLTMVVLPNRDRKAERREATRREILDTAWEIARRDSLAAVTLREVAQRIGMRSPSLYTASLAAYEQFRAAMAERGVRDQADLDLWTAILGGFVDQQLANEPGGIRWRCQLPRLVDMYCDEVGVSGPHLRRTR